MTLSVHKKMDFLNIQNVLSPKIYKNTNKLFIWEVAYNTQGDIL